jgi:signal transduction histidine kinase
MVFGETSRTLPPADAWELRFDWILSVFMWLAFVFGVALANAAEIRPTTLLVGAGVTGLYATILQVMPRRARRQQWVGELIALVGIAVSIWSISITNGIDSPFLIFLAVPTVYASGVLGFRTGIETAILSAAGLMFVATSLGQPMFGTQTLQAGFLYILISVTFAQGRRLVSEGQERQDELLAENAAARERMNRLATAHNLLTSLGDLATVSELNPMSVGDAALRDLAAAVPFARGVVSISSEDGYTVVAERGPKDTPGDPLSYTVSLGDRTLGRLDLWQSAESGISQHQELILETLRPLALAFDNIVLLREIARRAVVEERSRVARDLHDNIGPGLASIGLGIDMAMMDTSTSEGGIRHLDSLRSNVAMLVRAVRETVEHLRSPTMESLSDHAHSLGYDIGSPGPALSIELRERRTPPVAVASEIKAIMGEAIRNAVNHAQATQITIRGDADATEGTVIIFDDGIGFDPIARPSGHYGLIGMQERATSIGGTVSLDSSPGRGTTVTVTWKVEP